MSSDNSKIDSHYDISEVTKCLSTYVRTATLKCDKENLVSLVISRIVHYACAPEMMNKDTHYIQKKILCVLSEKY